MSPPTDVTEIADVRASREPDPRTTTRRGRNTFEKHFIPDFPAFVQKVLAWNPDHIVPVAKKACKLLKTIEPPPALRRNPDLVKYRSFFELTNASVKGKRIAVVDDATQYTSTLLDYRRFFEGLGATVATFCFVGHDELRQGLRWKDDTRADISKWLSEPAYQEYILQQSYHLLNSGAHFDLDHLVFEVPLRATEYEAFLSQLRSRGYLLFVEDYFLQTPIVRFSLDSVSFFDSIPYLNHPSVTIGPIRKVKFAYNTESEILRFSPLVFPSWRYSKLKYSGGLFEAVPFALPYSRAEHFGKKDKSALLRTYGNIQFAAAVSLGKAFVDTIWSEFGDPNVIKIRRNDLDALIGVSATNAFVDSIKEFLNSTTDYDFGVSKPVQRRAETPKYTRFAQVIDDLKLGYQKMLAERKSRIGVHYYLTYADLFRRYPDAVELSEHLDYYCDFGILVPGIVFTDGQITRGCRTGEPDSDYDWKRTQILIHLAVDQLRGALTKSSLVEPTAVNKLLANFVFDYPSQIHHELHCLVGEPYHFGTLVRVHHRHRAPSNPSIYESGIIGPRFYKWDPVSHKFSVKRPRGLASQARKLFDDKEQIPFSEIVTYFSLLVSIYSHFRTVDVLNLLSICRDESHFYSHVIHNIKASLAEYLTASDHERLQDRLKSLRTSLKHARSAHEKLELGTRASATIDAIKSRFGNDLRFVSAMGKLIEAYQPFDSAFGATMARLRQLTVLQQVLANLALLAEGKDADRIKTLAGEGIGEAMNRVGMKLPADLYSIASGGASCRDLLNGLCEFIRTEIDSLPRPAPLLVNRLKQDGRRRARNMATRWVYERDLGKATLLFIDFTGLRKLPEPKEEALEKFYALVERNCTGRGGEKLYGGSGGNDEFTIGFVEPETAIECAKDIKKDFAEDLFLHAAGDVKFGISVARLGGEKEKEIIDCWGNAKDCCVFKGKDFRNRGDLLISQRTLDILTADGRQDWAAIFEVVRESLQQGERLFRYQDISALR